MSKAEWGSLDKDVKVNLLPDKLKRAPHLKIVSRF
jgi:hypothetical protein